LSISILCQYCQESQSKNKDYQIESLNNQIFNSADTNQRKIDFVKEEIAANRYQIEPENIAARILEEHLITKEPEPA
jgi:anti-sigma28 factor (negative regulator of flagellin synthesis)